MKFFWLILGTTSLVVGTVGVVFPVLPTVPFYVLSVFAFSKSSKKLHDWFINTKLYKNNLESFINEKSMSLKSKIKLIVSLTIIIGICIWILYLKQIFIPIYILSVVYILHIIYFGFIVKNK